MSALRRLVAGVGVVLAVATAVTGGLVATAEPAAALTPQQMLASFNPADIISDQVMFNPGTMSASSIQTFLNKQVPTCENVRYQTGLPCLKDYRQTTSTRAADPMCSTYSGASNETAATIVSKVSRACGVNPQVLLVMLQKEEGLIQDTWPTSGQYRTAMGYGCPDTAACDSEYFGFFNQVYKAAWAMKRYTSPPGTSGPGWITYNWFPVGKASAVLYNPDYSCGSKTITIRNKATASLYYYTPYQPNAAALAAGYGVGDSCSAYGNRNFFLYFTSWFGSTHYAVTGAIKTFWANAGGSTGVLGNPTGNAATTTANGGGTWQNFEHGTVYSSAAGTWMMSGAIRSEYVRRGSTSGSLGWPAGPQKSVAANGGGTTQAFTSGDIYSSAKGTYAVRQDLRNAYGQAGGVTGPLGWPTATATTLGTGWVQRFTGGSAYWSSATGGFGVAGATDKHYIALSGPQGVLGWPRSLAASRTAGGITGTRQTFQQGDMYSSTAGTAAVMSAARAALGAVTSAPAGSTSGSATAPASGDLGWPTADAVAVTTAGGGTVQQFTGGRLYLPTNGAPVPVTGAMLQAYIAKGEVASSLGWPVSAATGVTAQGITGTQQVFRSGAIQITPTGTRFLTSSIWGDYRVNNGVAGTLGWATGNATHSTLFGQGWFQTFTGGTVFYSSVARQTHPLTGAWLTAFTNAGGLPGLGWPGGLQHVTDAGGGRLVVCTNGRLYSSSAGTVAVTGPVLTKYLALGATASRLGWPAGAATTSTTGTVQRFQHGTVSVSPHGWVKVVYS